jgi:hypothetical protein
LSTISAFDNVYDEVSDKDLSPFIQSPNKYAQPGRSRWQLAAEFGRKCSGAKCFAPGCFERGGPGAHRNGPVASCTNFLAAKPEAGVGRSSGAEKRNNPVAFWHGDRPGA